MADKPNVPSKAVRLAAHVTLSDKSASRTAKVKALDVLIPVSTDINFLTELTKSNDPAFTEIKVPVLVKLEELLAEKSVTDKEAARQAAAKEQEEAAARERDKNAKREAVVVRQVAELAAQYPDLESLTAFLSGAEPTTAQNGFLIVM